MTLVANVIPKRARDRNFFIVFLLSRITIPFGAKEPSLDPLMLSLGRVFPGCSDPKFVISEIASRRRAERAALHDLSKRSCPVAWTWTWKWLFL